VVVVVEIVPRWRGRARVPGVFGRPVEVVVAAVDDPPWRDPAVVAATLRLRVDPLNVQVAGECVPAAAVEAVRVDYQVSAAAVAVVEFDLADRAADQACPTDRRQGRAPVQVAGAAEILSAFNQIVRVAVAQDVPISRAALRGRLALVRVGAGNNGARAITPDHRVRDKAAVENNGDQETTRSPGGLTEIGRVEVAEGNSGARETTRSLGGRTGIAREAAAAENSGVPIVHARIARTSGRTFTTTRSTTGTSGSKTTTTRLTTSR
jgi:hypothetical protein